MRSRFKKIVLLPAIHFKETIFEIMGKGVVAIYDNQQHDGRWWFLLKPGMRFDIKKRQIVQ